MAWWPSPWDHRNSWTTAAVQWPEYVLELQQQNLQLQRCIHELRLQHANECKRMLARSSRTPRAYKPKIRNTKKNSDGRPDKDGKDLPERERQAQAVLQLLDATVPRDAEAAVQLYLSLTQDRTEDVSIAVAERFIPPDGKMNNQERIKAGSRLIAKAVCIGVARELVPHPQKMANQEKIMEASRLKASFTVAACKHVKGRVEQLEVLSKVMKAVTDRMSIDKLQAKTEQAEANKGKINEG